MAEKTDTRTWRLAVTLSALAFFLFAVVGFARENENPAEPGSRSRPALAAPNLENRVHKAGAIRLSEGNDGHFAYRRFPNADELDPETGLPSPGCEYPAESGIWYLYTGGLWLGAVVGLDTLVTTGVDGWVRVHEMFPDNGPSSHMIKRSVLPSSPFYAPDAVSDEDIVATTYDTLTSPTYVSPDPFENRPHRPLGVKIVQESYTWKRPGFDNFVLIKERVINIGQNNLQQLSIGLYFDTDIGDSNTIDWFADDISGSLVLSQELGVEGALAGWAADNDGDPGFDSSWVFNDDSALGAVAAAFLDPIDPVNESFNWWASAGSEPIYDWGPVLAQNNHPLGTGGIGTPSGDPNKYFFMSNHERDYDQIWSAVDLSEKGWLGPPPVGLYANDLASGWDARFLLSQRLGDLAPGDSLDLVFALAIGDNLHRDAAAFAHEFSAQDPSAFYATLDFGGVRSAFRAAKARYDAMINGVAGDATSDYVANISDAVFLIRYLFAGGYPPLRLAQADLNADCSISISDVVYLINYIFAGGAAPRLGCVLK